MSVKIQNSKYNGICFLALKFGTLKDYIWRPGFVLAYQSVVHLNVNEKHSVLGLFKCVKIFILIMEI